MENNKNILICPLNWGIGHATRCIPIIKLLLDQGYHVIIGADKRPYSLLKKEFPSLSFIIFPGYEIKYPTKGSMVFKILLSLPKIIFGIYKEHITLQNIIEKNKIDIVISDNRYGLWNKKVKSIFITHQLTVKCPKWLFFLEPILFQINKFFISKYNECWIPDNLGDYNITGELTKKYAVFKNIYFIGLLSRFFEKKESQTNIKGYDLVCILSGPEPQRSIFEKLLTEQLLLLKNKKTLILRGVTDDDSTEQVNKQIDIINHLNTDEFYQLIKDASLIICRSGYSSIMDIATLGKKAILIPTPGQTEQEYLASHLKAKKIFYSASQKEFNLMESIHKLEEYKEIKITTNHCVLKERINFLENKI